ncbi:MAG: LPXTG cell wall anchor domain-containing protein [Actinobacteria bacterium]|nr:LPXTG cell wall anchor domain-containing protein [Actinomycetota bacterium]
MGRHLVRALVAALLLLPAGAAVAQQAPENSSRCPQTEGAGTSGQYPPNRGALQLSRSAARPGQPVTARGCGFRPASTVNVDLVMGSQVTRVGTATVGADGGFELTFNVPANAPVGDHTVEATGVDPAGDVRVLSATLRVIGGEQGRDLPRTGSDSTAPLVTAGAGLVLLGGAAVVAARRRRAARVEA